MTLDLRDLAVFLAVERHGSFGRAAGELMVTQPAVSERVRHLERVVGRPLFERTAKGARLTPAGTALLPYAERCASLGEEALEAARRAEASPPLVLAVHSTFAFRIVPLVLGALGATPRRVSIRDVHSDQVTALVLDGVADFGFALPGGTPKGLVRTPLPPDDVVCVAGSGHRITRLRRAKIADLADCLIAANAWGDGASAFMAKLRSTGIDDWRIRLCGDAVTALALAKDHDHVALVVRSVVESFQRFQIVPLSGLAGWTVRLDLLYRRADRGDPVVIAVRDALIAM
jgi:DNA-binding transcriptional LysR family regulator